MLIERRTTEQPLAALHRRLGSPPGTDSTADADEPDVPSWIPVAPDPRGRAWLAAVRADPGRSGAIALALIAVLAVLVTVFTMVRSHPAPIVAAKLPPVEMASSSSPGSTAPSPGPPASVVVSVVGLVTQPGLVTLAPDARVADAVSAAGGALRGADTLGLNLARHVADGEQIVVGIATPAGQPAALGSSAGGAPVPVAPAGTDPAAPVDLNTATAEQLDALPGIGPVMAAAIIAWRQSNGKFASVDQLGEVDGIGPARLEKLRSLVRV